MERFSRPRVLAGAAGLALLLQVGPGAAARAAAEPPSARALAEKFFRNPFLTGLEISPDGSKLAALHSRDGQEMIVVRDLGGGEARSIVGLPDPEARFRWLRWANDRRLLYAVEEPMQGHFAPPRPRRTRLYAIDADGSNFEHLAKNWGKFLLLGRGEFQFEDDLIDVLEDDPDHVLMGIRKPTDVYPGIYRMEVVGGGLERVQPPMDGILVWFTDSTGGVRAGYGYENKRYRVVARVRPDGEFVELAEYSRDEDWLHFEGFAADPATLYVSRARDDGYGALYEYDLETRALGPEIFAAPGYDVPAWLEYSGRPKHLTAVGYLAQGPARHFVDDAAGDLQAALDHSLPSTFNRIVNESRDRNVAIIEASSDTVPPTYYLFDVAAKRLTHLASSHAELAGIGLAPMEAVEYTARDGMTIPAYLTVPRDTPPEDLPAVIYPHGGPSARTARGFEPTVQYLAALGFAVLQPNYRGSTGLGDAHEAAGLRQWGLAMQDDITDGVRWLVDSGVADAHRICIYGASYGGYAALMGLVATPELYRCAASYAGPTDLVMMLNDDKGYLFSEINVPLVGSSTKDREQLRATSPLQNVEKIRAPVFLAHGEDDERVNVSHSTRLAKQLQKAGKSVELMVFEDLAHSFRDEKDRIDFFARLGEFLVANTRPPPGGAPAADPGQD
jgi:dipeptidyl aminopeptidase/acylaminoacyl peptidase